MDSGLQDFKERIESLKSEIKLLELEGIAPICDGPINVESYYNSEVKVLWILMEPYGIEEGGADYSEWYQDWLKEYDLNSSTNTWMKNPTWKIVSLVSHAIFNGLFVKEMIDRGSKAILNSLGKIAWVNIRKVPHKNGSKVVRSDIISQLNVNSEILRKQVELLSPHVIICGGTFEILYEGKFVPVFGEYRGSIGDCDFRTGPNNNIVIDVKHPAYPFRSGKSWGNYVNELVVAVDLHKIIQPKLSDFHLRLADFFNRDYVSPYSRKNLFGSAESVMVIRNEILEPFSHAIGFGFDNVLSDFFIGICVVDSRGDSGSVECPDFRELLGTPDGESDNWPWWKWSKKRVWTSEDFSELGFSNVIVTLREELRSLIESIKSKMPQC